MGANLTGRFETRRDAEMAVERLVQEHGVDRGSILFAPWGMPTVRASGRPGPTLPRR